MENLKETVDIVVNSRYPEMNREGRELLAQVLIRKELEKGEMLLNEGQISRHMVFVGKGMLRQFYYKNGKDVTEHFSEKILLSFGTVPYFQLYYPCYFTKHNFLLQYNILYHCD